MSNGADQAFDDAACVLLVVDAGGRVERLNRAAVRLVGRPADALLGDMVDRALTTPGGGGPFARLVADAGRSGEPVQREVAVLGADGEQRMLQWTAAATAGGVVLSAADVTGQHRLNAQLAQVTHQALHDPLTGLPNRILLLEHLEQALRRLDRHGGELAVLFLDLDRFKAVNDTHGHEAGDRLLVALAERLRRALRPSDTVARLAGDEFVVVCEDIGNGTSAVGEIGERLLAAVERPFRIDEFDASVSMSIGVALARHSGTSAEALLRDADTAMYGSKQRGRARHAGRASGDVADFDPDELRAALQEGGLVVAYQPQVALGDGRLVGVEALARWRHPKLAGVAPAALVHSAEAAGLVRELGRQVWAAACRQAGEWAATSRAQGRPPPVVAVNLSASELTHPALADDLVAALDESGADPALLRVEVAEHTLLSDPKVAVEALRSVVAIGVGVALDDVGRDVASLEAMADLPVDELKLDRPWVWAAARPWAPGKATVVTVARLARRLGVRAVAEGVETDDELAAVRDQGYDVASGHWFAGPQTPEVVGQMVGFDLRWDTSGGAP